ncbi:MAG TPA: type VI secretion system-associated FHA domain protein TagH [Steroidobacteraceae bacterium]|nr:type VI secretion system-associated FHA domain protein TagH [Steroidobacteraceae bacterium]
MALRLTILSEQSAALGERATLILDKAGGTIGRADDNDWVLPDPNRYVSAYHARISYRNGSFIIEDTSTNGLYINDELDPVGRLGPQPLRAGDTLRLGAYRIGVRDSDATVAENSAIVPFSIRPETDEPGGAQGDIGVDLNISELLTNDADLSAARRAFDPWGNPIADSALLQFDTAQKAAAHKPRAASPARPAPAAAPPRAARSAATASPVAAAPAPNPSSTASVAALSPAAAAKAEAAAASALEAFCRGAGMASRKLPGEAQERLLRLAGLLLREALVGIKELARLQREIRKEAGLRADADEPERLALQNLAVEELLVRLLQGHDQRQLDAVQWLRELFGLASRHDAALMRALRPALVEFTERLNPAPQNPRSAAAARFRSITEMPDGRLPHLFIESLARSYNAEIGGGPKED